MSVQVPARTAPKLEPPTPPPRPICKAPGCARITKMRKAFCDEHVDQNSARVALLMARVALQELQDATVALLGPGVVHTGLYTADEILELLELEGPVSLIYLAQSVDRDEQVVETYICGLARTGLVWVDPSGQIGGVRPMRLGAVA